MTPTTTTIFRPEALAFRLQQSQRSQAEVVVPRSMRGRAAAFLWVLLVFLTIGGASLCFVTVPTSLSAPAIVTAGSAQPGGAQTALVLVPETLRPHLQPGERVAITFGGNGAPLEGTIAFVDANPLSGPALADRLGLPLSAVQSLQGPVAVVSVALPETGVDGLAPGAVGRATVAAGSRQAGSFLPLIHKLFGGE